eukprot:13827811-Alexandrium_andersonii.AAC.1
MSGNAQAVRVSVDARSWVDDSSGGRSSAGNDSGGYGNRCGSLGVRVGASSAAFQVRTLATRPA